MDIGFPIEKTVKARYSVRTYDGRPLDQETKDALLSYAAGLRNPLGPRIRIQIIEKDAAPDASASSSASKGEKLGTYGFIKGAQTYLAAIIPDEEYALEALGYDFEKLVLYAASRGLGTCWLGGTFNRSAFASRLSIGEREIFPILSPVGYPAQKMRLAEKLIRRGAKADMRMPWEQLFFKDGFSTPLPAEAAGDYRFSLEMVRLAPSAVNRQPWRVVMTDGAFHFFEKRSSGKEADTAGDANPDKAADGAGRPDQDPGVDMHRIDVGIAICHFHLAALEKGLEGRFERNCPDFAVPGGVDYIASWVMESAEGEKT